MKGSIICVTCYLLVSVVLCYDPKECTKSSDCAPNECCVLGMQRFSVPTCMAFGQTGDYCLIDNEPTDKDLYYPNKVVEVLGVYRLFCPCSESLTCSRARCSTRRMF